ncbi:predicted protein [Streptomyces viridosporus ATCC 14672]|uniref:Predicted protein n=1 Tax=Streptomyces viridosporus (strain ATCC 14672 / DSM 40746 / JCM 4963 / KCTC 9882 / NRRL B-12104 / FH 1290) TaxID=566461 RepID=D6AA71_STRV1|nr:predicted protein [Streptomyces viridosporus ATCC 14672]
MSRSSQAIRASELFTRFHEYDSTVPSRTSLMICINLSVRFRY